MSTRAIKQADLTIDEVTAKADEYTTVETISALHDADNSERAALITKLKASIAMGKELATVKAIFIKNHKNLDEFFFPYCEKRIARKTATVKMYCKLAKNESKIGHAISIQHAHDIIAGKCNDDGTYKPAVDPKVKNDDDFAQELIKLIPRFQSKENVVTALLGQSEVMAMLENIIKADILKIERARVKALKAKK